MRPTVARVVVASAVGVSGAALVVVASLTLWVSLTDAEKSQVGGLAADRAGLLLLLAVVLAAVFGFAFDLASQRHARPARRMAEELGFVLAANPGHRLTVAGPAEIAALAQAVNRLADQSESLRGDVDARIADARADLEEERNRLAALMSELSQSVLVCNLEGRILLYNVRARQLVGRGAGDDEAGEGVARSSDWDARCSASSTAGSSSMRSTPCSGAWSERVRRHSSQRPSSPPPPTRVACYTCSWLPSSTASTRSAASS